MINNFKKPNLNAPRYREKRLGILNKETIKEFKKGVEYLKIAYIYAKRIDYLLSHDDGEETFHTRLSEDLTENGIKL